MITPRSNKVLLGLSGGVDSTAAALLLKEKGYDVTGLFFDVLGNQEKEWAMAKQAADELGIPAIYRDVKDEFYNKIIMYFCNAYRNGETPNPCIMCNPTLKFQVMKEEAEKIGADYLATGHYAKITHDETEQRYYIERGSNLKKDQSYMLYRLDQSILSRLLLPLGHVEEKKQTRELVREHSIHNADKKDSQEICFIKNGSYIDYIHSQGLKSLKGNFVDRNGTILGEHLGLPHYTIGQRKGLGVAFGKPMFVIGLDPLKNEVILGENQDLFHRTVFVKNPFFTICDNESKTLPRSYEGKIIYGKIRYTAKPAKAILHSENEDLFRVVFDEPQRAATPGQSVVFYDGNRLLGGGFITKKNEE